jgi:hypothetical protein
MRSVTVFIKLALVLQAHAEEGTDSKKLSATSVDQLIRRSSDRMFNGQSFHTADLNDATLQKPSHLAMSSGTQLKSNCLGMVRRSTFEGVQHVARAENQAMPGKTTAATAGQTALGGCEEDMTEQPREVLLTRRRAGLAAAQAATTALWMPKFANAANSKDSPSTASELKKVEFPTFTLQVPSWYEEVDDEGSNAVLKLLDLRSQGAFNSLNTITLYKQALPEGGPQSVTDLGSPDDFAAQIIEKGQRKLRPVEMQSADTRKDNNGQLFYQVDYKRNVLGLSRHTLSELTIANGVMYTLSVDVDAKQWASEENTLREAISSLMIKPTVSKNNKPLTRIPA